MLGLFFGREDGGDAPLKRRFTFNALHGVTSHKTKLSRREIFGRSIKTINTTSIIIIVTCKSDQRWNFGLEIGFIDHFNTLLVFTLNYSTIADFHALPSLFQPAVYSLVVAW
jgi:hypothetical protein